MPATGYSPDKMRAMDRLIFPGSGDRAPHFRGVEPIATSRQRHPERPDQVALR